METGLTTLVKAFEIIGLKERMRVLRVDGQPKYVRFLAGLIADDPFAPR